MIDREEGIKQLSCEVVERFPENILKIFILENDLPKKDVGIIYLATKKEEQFWKSTLEMVNLKLQKRELSL